MFSYQTVCLPIVTLEFCSFVVVVVVVVVVVLFFLIFTFHHHSPVSLPGLDRCIFFLDQMLVK